jgi:hypothetical protein
MNVMSFPKRKKYTFTLAISKTIAGQYTNRLITINTCVDMIDIFFQYCQVLTTESKKVKKLMQSHKIERSVLWCLIYAMSMFRYSALQCELTYTERHDKVIAEIIGSVWPRNAHIYVKNMFLLF